MAKDRESFSIASFVQPINYYDHRPANTVLASRLQNELSKLTRLTCRSYTAVILKDMTDLSHKIFAQSNKVACNGTEELLRAPSVRDVSIKEKG
jgi:hypothetical protein